MNPLDFLKPGLFRSYTFRNTAWLTLGNYSVRVVGFLFVLFAYRRLSAEGYGGYVLANTYLSVLGIVSGLGLSNLINARVADDKKNAVMLPAYNLVSAALLLLATVALHAFKPEIPLGALAGFWLNSSLNQVLYMRFFQEQRHKQWAVFGLAQSCLANLAMLAALASGAGVSGLLEANYGCKAAACLYLLFRERGRISFLGGYGMSESVKAFRSLVKGSGLWMIANSIANKSISESVPIIFGEGASLSILGAYDMIFKVISLFDSPLYSMESIVTSRQSKANIGPLRKRYLPSIIGISALFAFGAFATILAIYFLFLKVKVDNAFMLGAGLFSLTVATLGYRVFSRASLIILEQTKSLMLNNLATTVFQLSYTIILVRSGNTSLLQVGLMYFATSLVSTFIYEINYSLAIKRTGPGF